MYLSRVDAPPALRLFWPGRGRPTLWASADGRLAERTRWPRHCPQRTAGCFAELDGMFAAAVWDDRERALHLLRDRAGIKPLYIYLHGTPRLLRLRDQGVPRDPVDIRTVRQCR